MRAPRAPQTGGTTWAAPRRQDSPAGPPTCGVTRVPNLGHTQSSPESSAHKFKRKIFKVNTDYPGKMHEIHLKVKIF